MRLVLVLLIGAALIWAYLEFSPAGEPRATGQVGTVSVEAPAPAPQPAPEPERRAEPEPKSDFALPEVASNPFAPSSDRARGEALVEVAAALAHGRQARFGDLLQEHRDLLGPVRVQGLGAFLRALEGDVPGARAVGQAVLADAGELSPAERVHLAAALGAGALPEPTDEVGGPLERAMAIRLQARLADFDAEQGAPAAAARRIGTAVELEFDAPWEIDEAAMDRWVGRLRGLERKHRWDPRGDWEGLELEARPGDSWIALRKRALAEVDGLVTCAGLIAAANGTDVDGTLRLGQRVRVPLDPVALEVDISKRWLLYRIGDEVVDAFPIAVGRPGEETPNGEYRIGNKQEEPVHWTDQGPIPYGDPENLLGTRWLGWRVEGENADTPYGFHGTSDPDSIGQAASEGCVRLLNEDVEWLFDRVPEGARVIVRD